MSMNICSITVTGNVTRDPELRTTPSGLQVLQFGLACNHGKKNDQEQTSFFSCNVYGGSESANKRIQSLHNYMYKGGKVAIVGDLLLKFSEDGKLYANIGVHRVELLSYKNETNESQSQSVSQPATNQQPKQAQMNYYSSDIPF